MTKLETQEQRQRREERKQRGYKEDRVIETVVTVVAIVTYIVALFFISSLGLGDGWYVFFVVVGAFTLLLAHEVTAKNKEIKKLQRENSKFCREIQELKMRHK